MKTEKWIRTWLEKKIDTFKYWIKHENAYGSKKQIKTLVRDLRKIADELESYLTKK